MCIRDRVAQRHDVTRQQIYAWRHELKKKGLLSALPEALFLPVEFDRPMELAMPTTATCADAPRSVQILSLIHILDVYKRQVLAGLIAAVAALVQTGSIAVGSVRVGLDLPILAVAATILGGVVFGRGEGGVWGPFFGVLSFALLFVVMTVFGVGDPGKLIAQGLIILMAAILYGWRSKRG